MARATEVVWDGKFIQNMPAAEAATKQAAGLVQIFEGPQGYQPGFYMAVKFPLTVPAPDPILTAVNPSTGTVGVEIPLLSIEGENFTLASQVIIGGQVAANVALNSPFNLRIPNYTPPAAGTIPVLVRTPGHPDTATRNMTIAAA
jgi:hypothetical protein